jgi:hypothetical protein
MVPSRFPEPNDPSRWAEGEVFRRLQELDDGWLVLYSVGWQSMRNGKQGDGEIDFLLLHQQFGVFCVEVKGGSTIEVDGRDWYSWNRDGRHKIRNPFEQASSSKYALRSWLSERTQSVSDKTRMGHFVIFPSADQESDLGPDAPRAIIWDRRDLSRPNEAIRRVVNHWDLERLERDQVSEIKKALLPELRLIPSKRQQVDEALHAIDQLTNRQWQTFQLLRRRRRALVSGAAGTGKTVLAFERAHQLATDGFKVLLTCFNRPLGDRLQTLASDIPNLTVLNFHSLCQRYVDESGIGATLLVDDEDFYLNVELPELLPDAADLLGVAFDAIVVDEGQDFRSEWWTPLELLLRDSDESTFVVFADSNQSIYVHGWLPPFSDEPFPLDVNCRNTKEIAERVYRTGLGVEASLEIAGPRPASKQVASRERAVEAVKEQVSEVIAEFGLSPAQVAVLTSSSDLLSDLEREHWSVPIQSGRSRTGVLLETIHRFKGLESDAIVLAFDPEVDLEVEGAQVLGYVGMSRAKTILRVIATKNVLATLKWAEP